MIMSRVKWLTSFGVSNFNDSVWLSELFLKSMRKVGSLSFLLMCFMVVGQQDMVILKDYSKILMSTKRGKIQPIADITSVQQAGFFLNALPVGNIRVCNDSKIIIWVNGRLVKTQKGCKLIDPVTLFKYAETDTIYVSFSVDSFENFKCELVGLEAYQLVRSDEPTPRKVRNIFREFNIIAIAILFFCLALFSHSFPARFNYFIYRTYTLNTNSYQMIHAVFFGKANLAMMLLVSLFIAFELVYINHQTDSLLFSSARQLAGFFATWTVLTFWILMFFFAKQMLIQFVAGFFKMKRLKNWQLLDLVNFFGYFALLPFIVIFWDFVINISMKDWIGSYFVYYFLISLLLFELWVIVKFIMNSSRKKFLMISYLCATEIVPTMFFVGWLFE